MKPIAAAAPPPEIMAKVHEAALEEGRLRSYGASQERLGAGPHKQLSIELAMLAARGFDISSVYPDKREPDSIADISPADEAKIERLVDTSQFTYDDARRRVVGR